jgi:hypothetical protein
MTDGRRGELTDVRQVSGGESFVWLRVTLEAVLHLWLEEE